MSSTSGGGLQLTLSSSGVPLEGVLQATILSTTCYSADTFSATLALGASPLTDPTFWAEYASGAVELNAVSSDGALTQSLIAGLIDRLEIDPLRGTATIEGRDFSALLIEAYSQRDFVNQTASEVVTTIALEHGLTPVVAPTSGLVGRYYGDGYTRLSLGQFSRLRSDWDLVVELARENAFDAYVFGSTLYFQPPTPTVVPIQIDVSEISSLHVERNFTVGGEPGVLVRSWNSQDMTAYTSQPTATAVNDAPQPFLFGGSNLTSSQVDASASQLSRELGRLQTVLHLETPWDLTLTPGATILLTGTLSPFDAVYTVDRIERSFSACSGSSQRIRAIGTSMGAAS